MSIFEKVSAELAGSAFGSVVPFAAGAAATIGTGILKSKLPPGAGPKPDAAIKFADRALAGDFTGAVMGAINSGIFTSRLPWLDNAAEVDGYMAQPSRASAGLRPMDAKRIIKESLETNFGRKNLFMVSISDKRLSHAIYGYAGSGKYTKFNMFVTDISYGPCTLTAEAYKVGSAVLDAPNGTEPIELRITTLDDESGLVKRWFKELFSRVAHQDGTFGVPADYLVTIGVLHSFVTDDSRAGWLNCGRGFNAEAMYRPVSMELDLSRKDDALEEVTLVFHQFDTSFPA